MTDRDLAMLDQSGIGDDVRMMARELIERRAKDLTAEEISALVDLRTEITANNGWDECDDIRRALAKVIVVEKRKR